MRNLEWNLDDAKQAWQEAREQERENFAAKLIRRGRPFDEIHEDTGLPLQRIKELAQADSAKQRI